MIPLQEETPAPHIALPKERKTPKRRWLKISGARGHNLKEIDVRFPVGLFTAVTGVNGSGKSTLVNETLYPALAREINSSREVPLPHGELNGLHWIDKVVDIDQSPIGRTPRSKLFCVGHLTTACQPIRNGTVRYSKSLGRR